MAFDQSASERIYDVVIVGGGPAGATAANTLASAGYDVALIDKAGRIKPCGGAVPPRLINDYAVPDELIVARINTARIISPSSRSVDMHIDGGFVGMVDREHFDDWLRQRAAANGATRITGQFETFRSHEDGGVELEYRDKDTGITMCLRARLAIGADGARSEFARKAIPKYRPPPSVFAYHEIIKSPPATAGSNGFDERRCDVVYNGKYSPDFYAWVFPHGSTTSVGVGSAVKGFSLRQATAAVRQANGLSSAETVRREGAPIPLKPLRKWDNGKNAVLAGDAAGVVAPASGEGIYYAMLTGQFAAEAAVNCLKTGNAASLAGARKRFMKAHGRIFWVLGMLQYFWYHNDKRREQFVKICQDEDVQRLTWQSYMYKEMSTTRTTTHARIFFKDLAHLVGWART